METSFVNIYNIIWLIMVRADVKTKQQEQLVSYKVVVRKAGKDLAM